MPRQLLESEKIFKGAVFDVERDRLREENGIEIIREVVSHPGGAGALPLFDDGRVALVKQYRHPARSELLEIPAGRIEVGETPEMCAAREVEILFCTTTLLAGVTEQIDDQGKEIDCTIVSTILLDWFAQ